MPYADPSARKAYQAQRRRESVANKRYTCRGCGYSLRDPTYLRNHERSCTVIAENEHAFEAALVEEALSPVTTVVVEAIPEPVADAQGGAEDAVPAEVLQLPVMDTDPVPVAAEPAEARTTVHCKRFEVKWDYADEWTLALWKKCGRRFGE